MTASVFAAPTGRGSRECVLMYLPHARVFTKQSTSSGDWVSSSGVPWVTAREALHGEPTTPNHTVPLDSSDRIRRASRGEPAVWRQEGRDHLAVGLDGQCHESRRHVHCITPLRRSAWPSEASKSPGAAWPASRLATSATSKPSHGPPARRTASRMTLLARLRQTAPPRRLPATNITRPSGPRDGGVGTTMSVMNLADERRPPLKMESTSVCAVMVRMASRSRPTGC